MAGNANSGPKREKPFRDALLMELKAAGEDHKALRRIARAIIEKASDGDIQAIKEVADRMDGKVPQGIEGGGTPIQTESTIIVTGVPRPQDVNADN